MFRLICNFTQLYVQKKRSQYCVPDILSKLRSRSHGEYVTPICHVVIIFKWTVSLRERDLHDSCAGTICEIVKCYLKWTGIATCYGLDSLGFEFPAGARSSAPVQTGPEAYPACYSSTMGNGQFLGVKHGGCGVYIHPNPAQGLKKK